MTWQAANSPKDLSSHYAFGEDWADYARKIDDSRIVEAEAGLKKLLGEDGLSGKTFLDVGCGSGLHSLAALRLGTDRVLALDIDPASVMTVRTFLQPGYIAVRRLVFLVRGWDSGRFVVEYKRLPGMNFCTTSTIGWAAVSTRRRLRPKLIPASPRSGSSRCGPS